MAEQPNISQILAALGEHLKCPHTESGPNIDGKKLHSALVERRCKGSHQYNSKILTDIRPTLLQPTRYPTLTVHPPLPNCSISHDPLILEVLISVTSSLWIQVLSASLMPLLKRGASLRRKAYRMTQAGEIAVSASWT